jgi:sugar/nucleoside kinase (ribokinase family)
LNFDISKPTDKCILLLREVCLFEPVVYKIPITPKPHCVPNDCHNNVARYVSEYGGEHVKGYYFITNIDDDSDGCAIYHSVVRKDGVLIDITPHNDTRTHNLFAAVNDELTFSFVNTRMSKLNRNGSSS